VTTDLDQPTGVAVARGLGVGHRGPARPPVRDALAAANLPFAIRRIDL
jgi:hypothetical protein